MQLTRRTLLGAGTVAGVGLLLPLRMTTSANAVVPAFTPFTEPLPTLADLGVIDATGGPSRTPTTATITMVNASHSFHAGFTTPTPTFAYRTVSVGGVDAAGGQDYLGPVIVARQDVPFELTVVNNLGAHPLTGAIDAGIPGVVAEDASAPRAAVHLHGGNTEAASDGDPLDHFPSGGTIKVYNYGNTQEAAGLWYHDHALGITRLNVFAGLAGGYLVRDANDPGDGNTGLPPAVTAGYGDYEVPLVIQDRMFNLDGSFLYPINPGPFNSDPTALQKWMPEFFGDVATVNGKIMPSLDVARGKYRFRVYNGSNARFYNFKLKTSLLTTLPIFQIGTDGGLLNAPVKMNTLLLGPGERADIVVDFAALPAGTTVVLTNDAKAPYPNGPRALIRGGSSLPQIMQFKVNPTVVTTTPWTTPLPPALRTTAITRLAGLVPTATRNITLVEILHPVFGPQMALMNNRRFEEAHVPAEPTLTVTSDTLEQWNFINTTGDAHPMHLHFAQFQLLNRQKFDVARYVALAYPVVGPPGGPPLLPSTGSNPPPAVPAPLLKGRPMAPAANEMGWKDTVMALPGEVTRILVPFGANAVPDPITPGGFLPMAIGASHTGPYVSHCHILEHEENDMMLRYVIEPPPAP